MGRVALTVNDLDRVAAYYEQVVGLRRLRSDGETVALGADNEVLLELRRDPSARRRSPREAGLFHTAFLLPHRSDLGQWLRHATASRIPLLGASDHAVSEAIYLADPEGNGIEIYRDRPASEWRWTGRRVEMTTEPLDIADLMASGGDQSWTGFPPGSRVGHVHLQVGAITPAEDFYAGVLGLDLTCHYPGGSFFAAHGYHHHIATNIWNSRGAAPRSYPSTGLADVEIHVEAADIAAIAARAEHTRDRSGSIVLRDPWGTAISLVTSPAS